MVGYFLSVATFCWRCRTSGAAAVRTFIRLTGDGKAAGYQSKLPSGPLLSTLKTGGQQNRADEGHCK
jgi:hypothetical protein